MAKKSAFKRLMKVEKGLPKSGVEFLRESKVHIMSHTLVAGWIKGEFKDSRNYVIVLQNIEDETYLVLYRNAEGIIVTEKYENLYQTFLAHKAARFA